MEHRPFLCGSSGGGDGIGRTVCGGGTANGVVARADVLPFMVSPVCIAFGVLLLYPQWTASLWLLTATYALLAYPFVAKDVLAAWDGLPKDYAAAARTMGANGFQTACYVTAPLLKPALRRGLTLASATYRRICGHIVPVAPRMADADHFDLRLSRARRCGQLRTGDGVDGSIDRFGFDGIFCWWTKRKDKRPSERGRLKSLRFPTYCRAFVSKID